MDEDDQIKIGDFGTAKILVGTLARSNVGTIPYWSPEMIKMHEVFCDEKITITSKSDIW